MTFEQAKSDNPLMRRKQPVGNIHSGSVKTVLQCCLCGCTHSYCTRWAEPLHSLSFREHHNAGLCQPQDMIA